CLARARSDAVVDHHGALHVPFGGELLVGTDVLRQLLARDGAEAAPLVEVEVVVHRDQGEHLDPALTCHFETLLDESRADAAVAQFLLNSQVSEDSSPLVDEIERGASHDPAVQFCHPAIPDGAFEAVTDSCLANETLQIGAVAFVSPYNREFHG